MAGIPLQGSERGLVSGAQILAPADAAERLEVSVLVRRRDGTGMRARAAAFAGGGSPGFLTRDEFTARHGADPVDFDAVRKFAAAHGLAVVGEHASRRTVILAGTVAQFSAAFGVELHRMSHAGGTYRGRTGVILLPPELHGVVEAVLGLDDRPQAHPHFRSRPSAAASAGGSFTPVQVADLYGFPPGSGAGQCVGIIELGGGYRPADLKTYFAGLGIASPSITAVSVDHAKNAPTGSAGGPDGEVMLDIEVVGAIVPGARIVVYFAPNTDAGFLDAVTTALHDSVNAPSVISISWGGPESTYTPQALTAMDDAFQAAATLGITVCCASGDNGSSDGVTSGGDHVDFPASSSYALACGGTRLTASAAGSPAETVWNDGAGGGASGGGVSAVFALPAWQHGLAVVGTAGSTPLAMRGVPDVAGDADPATGYTVRVDGADSVYGGTSAVAPLWAALIARLNAAKGSNAGFVNPTLYANPAALRDVTDGNNGDFAAAPGWDACTGLGSPDGAALAALFG